MKQVLEELGGFEVFGEAANGRQVLDSPLIPLCDVLVLDLSLPLVSGPEVLRRVRARWPDVAVVVLSMHPEAQFARRALADGAAAYVSKEGPPAELVAAVRRAGEGIRDEPEAPPMGSPHLELTRRENQVFMRVIEGHAVVDIAAELNVHACTVSNHLAKVRRKLGVATGAETVRYAMAHGLLDPGPGWARPTCRG